jgi:hypothetical protein
LRLKDAIKHSEEIVTSYKNTSPDCDCAKEHKQLAKWLRELREIRNCVYCLHRQGHKCIKYDEDITVHDFDCEDWIFGH